MGRRRPWLGAVKLYDIIMALPRTVIVLVNEDESERVSEREKVNLANRLVKY